MWIAFVEVCLVGIVERTFLTHCQLFWGVNHCLVHGQQIIGQKIVLSSNLLGAFEDKN